MRNCQSTKMKFFDEVNKNNKEKKPFFFAEKKKQETKLGGKISTRTEAEKITSVKKKNFHAREDKITLMLVYMMIV